MNRRNFLRKSLGLLAAMPLMGLFAKAPQHRDCLRVLEFDHRYLDISVRRGRFIFPSGKSVGEMIEVIGIDPWVSVAPGWKRESAQYDWHEDDGVFKFIVVDRKLDNRTKDGSNGRAECTVA